MGNRGTLPWLALDKRVRVAVVGDVILDEYLEGQVNRISPEAPVPVHLVTNTIHGAGGAANTARNIQLVGGQVSLYSVWGDDEASRYLKAILQRDGIDIKGVFVDKKRPTIRKTRITSGSQQLVRIDWEQVHAISKGLQEKILDHISRQHFDVLLISDYGKGVLPAEFLAELIHSARQNGLPIVVDPKGRDFTKYAGATLLTPNRKEACEALGLDPVTSLDAVELGRGLQKAYNLENILVTLGAKGMLLVPSNQGQDGQDKVTHLPAIAREVYDVSGAGDTVVALMALSLGSKIPFEEAMYFATAAAAVVVGKWGTQPITQPELESAVNMVREESQHNFVGTDRKIVSIDQLLVEVKSSQHRTKRVVFTNGCFDILHAGHVTYLEEARKLGDVLVVGINSDESITRLKGKSRPIVSLSNRMRLLAALGCIDYVVSFAEDTPYQLISSIQPDILVKGADWSKDKIVGADIVERLGGRVETVKLVDGLSTTNIIARIKETLT